MARQPRAKELFGVAVRPRHIDVPDAELPRRVEQLVAARAHRFDRPFRGIAEVVVAADRDVGGTSDGGEPEAERRRALRCVVHSSTVTGGGGRQARSRR